MCSKYGYKCEASTVGMSTGVTEVKTAVTSFLQLVLRLMCVGLCAALFGSGRSFFGTEHCIML